MRTNFHMTDLTGRSSLALVGLLLLAALATCASFDDESRDELPKGADMLIDESQNFEEGAFGQMFKDFGQRISDVMTSEMDKLLSDVALGADSKSPPINSQIDKHAPKRIEKPVDKAELEQLKNANKIVSSDVKARIELAAVENDANLPRAGFGVARVSSLFSQASSKISSAGRIIGERMSSMNRIIKGVPSKLRKLLRWPDFLKFKLKYRKNYKSIREELYRHMVYLYTQTTVCLQWFKFLFRREKYILRATQFSDMTEKEFHGFVHNPMLAAPIQERSTEKELSSSEKDQLLAVAKSGKNIFGKDVSRKKRSSDLSKRRRKRQAEPIIVDSSELDDEDETFGGLEDDPMDIDSDDMADSEDEDEDEFDCDESEIDEFAGGRPKDLNNLESIMDDAVQGDPDFEPIDLRDTGCFIRPENQENCGSCYAHAATTAAQFYNCIATGTKREERRCERYNAHFAATCGAYLVNATTNPPVRGCRGGLVYKTVEFIAKAGTMNFHKYEYARYSAGVYDSNECAFPRPESLEGFGDIPVPYYQQSTYRNIGVGEIGLHLRAIGPVFLNTRVWKDYKQYGSGIVSTFEVSATSTIHSMLIVGHDRDALGKEYFILLNSHGIPWGENGYVRIYADSLAYFKSYLAGLVPNDWA